jgi:cytochrome c-type biogenesis protein CcmH/NrfF
VIKKILLLFYILILSNVVYAGSAQTNLEYAKQISIFKSVSGKLVCQCNCLMILSVCNHENCPSGIPMRKQIESRIQQGWTEDQIIQEFVEKEGVKILSAPPARGFHLAAWIIPGMVALIGLLIIFFSLKKLRKNSSEQIHTSRNPDMDERIEQELKKWES